MNGGDRLPAFDPYEPLEPNLEFGDRLNRWLLARPRQQIARRLKGQRVLDVCCGTGNLAAMLAASGCQVLGVDSSATMLSHARRKDIAAEFEQLEAARLPFAGEFDAAVISLALHEMPSKVRAQVWLSMRRAVHPDGCLIALDFAVPLRDSLAARLASGLIERDERSLLAIHPEHYHNFREFMQNGGLLGWIRNQGQPLRAEYRFWAGTLAVAIALPGAGPGAEVDA